MLLCEEMVGSSWKKYFPCLRPNVHPAPSRSGGDGNSDADPRCSREGDNVDDGPCCSGGCDNVDALLWHKDLCPHVYGEFSMAVVQANPLLEDHSQVESGPLSMIEPGPQGTFAGIYDGHGGPEVARFINQKLFANVKKFISENEAMSEDVIKDAYLATDEEFISSIKEQWETKPQLASVGSCCLVGVLCGEQLYIANAGDSRVVLGRLDLDGIQHVAVQLSKEHNANLASVREELHQLHHDDSHIVVPKGEVWRVKGIIQVSRAIGDAYLKNAEFNREPLLAKFRLSETFEKPIMTAAPSVLVHKILPIDRFLIFASDGLWEHLTNRQAVDIVTRNDRNGIAKSLIEAAQLAAANKIGISFSELKTVERGERRKVHDDITVIVLYLDWDLIDRSSNTGSCVSVKGGLGASSSDPCTSGKH